jgi:hypothetical protein
MLTLEHCCPDSDAVKQKNTCMTQSSSKISFRVQLMWLLFILNTGHPGDNILPGLADVAFVYCE